MEKSFVIVDPSSIVIRQIGSSSPLLFVPWTRLLWTSGRSNSGKSICRLTSDNSERASGHREVAWQLDTSAPAAKLSVSMRVTTWTSKTPTLLGICLSVALVGCAVRHTNVQPLSSIAGFSFTFPPDSVVTVQSNPTDPALVCSDLHGFPKHSNNRGAFDNLLIAQNPQESFIVGQGEAGKLCTGGDGRCNTTATSLNSNDADDWRPYANAVSGRFPRLTLLGCNVGLETGATLVARVAEETRMTVAAPTGLVWCEGGSLLLDPQSRWIEAKPGEHPEPVHAPLYSVPPESEYSISIRGKLQPIPASTVHVDQFRYSFSALRTAAQAAQDEAARFAARIDFANPFVKKASLLALTTGRIQLTVALDGGGTIVKHYTLYADAVVGDLDDPGIFYPVDSRLHGELQALRQE
jgi:hypothetical protein